jgi:hypothetical protein
MGISREVIASGIVITAFLFCQFINTVCPVQSVQNNIPVELTGSIS